MLLMWLVGVLVAFLASLRILMLLPANSDYDLDHTLRDLPQIPDSKTPEKLTIQGTDGSMDVIGDKQKEDDRRKTNSAHSESAKSAQPLPAGRDNHHNQIQQQTESGHSERNAPSTTIVTSGVPQFFSSELSGHRVCPKISIGNCSSWHHTEEQLTTGVQRRWVFNNSFCRDETTNKQHNKVFYMSRDPPFEKRPMIIPPPPYSFVFFGSSHIRELYMAFIRLHRGTSFSSFLEKQVLTVRNGNKPKALLVCDPHRTGYKNGTYGVDLESCGVPGKRLVPELGDRVAIGFKTFLHTPVADQLFVEFLQNRSDLHLRYPSVILTDVGVWGPRGNRFWKELNYSMTMDEEIDHNFQWLRETFPTSVLIFVKEHQYYDVGIEPWVNPKMEEFVQQDPRAVLLDKDRLMENLPRRMKCDHGCAGPVLTVMAHMVLDWLEEALRRSNGCLNLPAS